MQAEWVMVTGASAGIGRELSKIFAGHGHNLVLVARGEARLAALGDELTRQHGVQVRILARDLSRPGVASEIFSELQKQGVRISILVNNAGFGTRGAFAKGDAAVYREMIEVNVTSLVELTHLFMRPMVEQGRGRILNLSSTAAFQPGPMMAIYYATKSFVSSFSYALANELKGTGVTVTTLCPGPTRTEFQQRAGKTDSEKAYRAWWAMEARDVAEIGYRGLMAGKRVVIPGLINWLGCRLTRIAPTRLAAGVARKVIEG
jgi:short-subunit dehydrogenase